MMKQENDDEVRKLRERVGELERNAGSKGVRGS